jgi:hypothetical protein
MLRAYGELNSSANIFIGKRAATLTYDDMPDVATCMRMSVWDEEGASPFRQLPGGIAFRVACLAMHRRHRNRSLLRSRHWPLLSSLPRAAYLRKLSVHDAVALRPPAYGLRDQRPHVVNCHRAVLNYRGQVVQCYEKVNLARAESHGHRGITIRGTKTSSTYGAADLPYINRIHLSLILIRNGSMRINMKLPVAEDGSFFGPHLRHAGEYQVGERGSERKFSEFAAALAFLKAQPKAYWRRPNSKGNMDIVVAVEWDNRAVDEFHPAP